MKTNLPQHPCANKCTNFRDEQCHACLIQQVEQREFELGIAPEDAYVKYDFVMGDVVVSTGASNHLSNDWLWLVLKVEADQIRVARINPDKTISTRFCFWISPTDIRTASSAERKAKSRIGEPVAFFVSASNDEERHLNRAIGAQRWVT